MKNVFSPFTKLVAVAACALTLGGCNRAEYAMLPKGGSYHGVTRVSTPVPAPLPASAAAESPVPAAKSPIAVVQPVTPAAKAPVAPGETKSIAASAPNAPTLGAATSSQAVPTRKPSLVQRWALAKVTKKVEKAAQKSGKARQHDNTSATQKLTGKLRQGIILVLIGVLVEILAAAIGSGLIYLLGAILVIIGLVLIVLYLLDEL